MTTFQRIIKYLAIAFAFLLIIGMAAGAIKGLSLFSKVLDFTGSDGKIEEIEEDSKLTKLRIDLFRTNLVIVEGEDFAVETDNRDVTVKERLGTLIIEENNRSILESSGKTEVVLTIPKDFVFESVDISTGAGEFSAEVITAEKVELDFGAGEVSIDKLVSAVKTEIDGGAGKISVHDGKTHNLSLDMGVGKVNYRAEITGRSEIDSGMGGIDLTLLGNEEDYKVELDKGIGIATIKGVTVTDEAVHGSGENKIDIDGGVGDIKVDFE